MYNTEYANDHAVVTDTDTPNLRFIVMQDTDTESPAGMWDTSIDFHVFNSPRYGQSNTAPEGLGEVFARFYDEHNCDSHRALTLTRRYAVAFLGWNTDDAEDLIETYTARGYSQSDWWDVFVASRPGYGPAKGYAEEWEQWARGDVYYVFPEQFEECEHPENCHGDEDDHWTREPFNYDGCGGVYADDAEKAAEYYAKDFM